MLCDIMFVLKEDSVFAKIYDKLRLIISLFIVSPLLMLAFLTIVIGYPVHLVKKLVMRKEKACIFL